MSIVTILLGDFFFAFLFVRRKELYTPTGGPPNHLSKKRVAKVKEKKAYVNKIY